MRRHTIRVLAALAASTALAGTLSTALPADAVETPHSYLVITTDGTLPTGLTSQVAAAGSRVTDTIPQVGVVATESTSADFATRAAAIPGVRSVIPNVTHNYLDDNSVTASTPEAVGGDNPPSTGDDDTYFPIQWALDAIDAPQAWNAGQRGAGVRVAVIDNGIDSSNPELAPNLNTDLSASFVDGETVDDPVPPGTFRHGTYVSGVIAAADNQNSVVGVAPEVELVAVKSLSSTTPLGTANLEDVVEGIIYAADIDADVINMSFSGPSISRGGYLDGNGVLVTAPQAAEERYLMARATRYAHQQGSTLIAAAGNAATDLDHDADSWVLPAMSPHVNAVSATAPEAWCLNHSTDLDLTASYSNFGSSVVDFAAPGGDFDNPATGLCTFRPAGTFGISGRPRVFDQVIGLSSLAGVTVFQRGTSVAAPHVSGVAALIIGNAGGDLPPVEVAARLRASADDLGQPGRDAFYGFGRVNAWRAVQ